MALAHTKNETTKISSEGLTGKSAEVYTSENFPLYGTQINSTRATTFASQANLA